MDIDLADKKLFLARLVIGLVQGAGLYLLYRASDEQFWPASNGLVFAPLLLVWLYVPILLTLALGEMPWQRAALWALVAAVSAGLLALYDNWADWPVDWGFGLHPVPRPHILNTAQLYFAAGAGLFTAQALVVGGQAEHRIIASYPRHFDVAWKLAVQLALAALFVGAFWLLLWLGADLFNLIKLDFFQKLIQHEWFTIPASTLAAAGALHLTDIRPALVRGARTLLLTLLSWLLPVIALIVAGFLASLPFTGLAPLWSFGHASALLLATCAGLILLINAAHQDGDPERLPPKLLQVAGTVAALLPVPLSLIAGYALLLRIQQYGWTVDRVSMAAAILIACCYAAGYAVAAVTRGPWLARIERWNFYCALLILGAVAALFSPVASPARIAVADQMARLRSGKVAPGKFDYAYLRWSGGRYGRAALILLTQSETGSERDMARAALGMHSRYMPLQLSPEGMAARVTVYPSGRKLPASFMAFWSKSQNGAISSSCMYATTMHCDAVLVDLDGDGVEEILLIPENAAGTDVYHDAGQGNWQESGGLTLPRSCPAILAALREGRFSLVAPQRQWKDIEIGGQRLQVTDAFGWRATAPSCPK